MAVPIKFDVERSVLHGQRGETLQQFALEMLERAPEQRLEMLQRVAEQLEEATSEQETHALLCIRQGLLEADALDCTRSLFKRLGRL